MINENAGYAMITLSICVNGGVTKEYITVKCPNCGYRKEYDEA